MAGERSSLTWMPYKCHINGMRTTIDKAGRVVIPARLRERAGLTPGTAIELIQDDLCIRLIRSAPRPQLRRRGKLMVARPAEASRRPAKIDLAALIEDERNRWPG